MALLSKTEIDAELKALDGWTVDGNAWSTHSDGGVTTKDLDGARMAERQFRKQ